MPSDRRQAIKNGSNSAGPASGAFFSGWRVVLLRVLLAFVSSTSVMLVSSPKSLATRPPESLKETLKQVFPKARVRLDGVIESGDGSLFIPLIPKNASSKSQSTQGLQTKYPSQSPTLYAFKNGWYYLKLVEKNGKKILELPPQLNDAEKKKIGLCSLPSDLIVPADMFVSVDLKASVGDLNIPCLDAATKASLNQTPVVTPQPDAAGIIAVTSPQTGKIAMLGSSLQKLSELPTDGTPGGMAFAAGKLFIADQTKNRILIVDPKTREFAGQIDFPPGSGPKDVAAQMDGSFLYVSECAANKVGIVELSTGKILMHTLVPAGPTRLKLTPNGYTLLVLNVPAGKLSFLSTLNQRISGVVPVGHMPSDVAVSPDSRLAFVSNRLSNTISVLDVTQRKFIRTLDTGEGPTGVEVSKDGSLLLVANAKDNTVSVFDIASMSKVKDVTLPIDVEFPTDIMLLPDGKHLLVTSAATDSMGMLNLDSLEFEKQPALGCTSVDLIYIPL